MRPRSKATHSLTLQPLPWHSQNQDALYQGSRRRTTLNKPVVKLSYTRPGWRDEQCGKPSIEDILANYDNGGGRCIREQLVDFGRGSELWNSEHRTDRGSSTSRTTKTGGTS